MALPACALALVLLMDVSGSMAPTHYEVQRDGTAAALRSAEVRAAIRGAGEVAITVVEWSYGHRTTVPWTIVRSDSDVLALADAVGHMNRTGGTMTYMGGALMGALEALQSAPCSPERKVVDISGNGHSNAPEDEEGAYDDRNPGRGLTFDDAPSGQGSDPRPGLRTMKNSFHVSFRAAHLLAEARGIQINGLPIVTAIEPDVAQWYSSNVPANGGFIVISNGYEGYKDAILRKLETEISQVTVSPRLGHG